MALGLLVVYLLPDESLSDECLPVVEQGLGGLLGALERQLALGDLPVLARAADAFQEGPLHGREGSQEEGVVAVACGRENKIA